MQGVVNLMAKGAVPSDMRPWVCGASLNALPKPTGDHRPVAAGETLRRVAAKALTMASAPEVGAYLEPVQMGVGTKQGRKPSCMLFGPGVGAMRTR